MYVQLKTSRALFAKHLSEPSWSLLKRESIDKWQVGLLPGRNPTLQVVNFYIALSGKYLHTAPVFICRERPFSLRHRVTGKAETRSAVQSVLA
jgi:hypothetical protein